MHPLKELNAWQNKSSTQKGVEPPKTRKARHRWRA
jgi:hypothetical protein